jgi:hypothetical protein
MREEYAKTGDGGFGLFPGRDTGYPSVPPTDPDVRISTPPVPRSPNRLRGRKSVRWAYSHPHAEPCYPLGCLDVVENSGLRQRELRQYRPRELSPIDLAFVTSPSQPIPPCLLSLFIDPLQGLVVSSNPEVLVVPSQLPTQRLVLVPYPLMTGLRFSLSSPDTMSASGIRVPLPARSWSGRSPRRQEFSCSDGSPTPLCSHGDRWRSQVSRFPP